jgi:tRNA (mo5U34)-methyltransferase
MSLQAQIDAVQWYHEFDFGNGLVTKSQAPDIEAHRRVWAFIKNELDLIELRGKSILDIGCWDGFWSFYAEGRGAREILATDDILQNWSDGSGIRLAKQLLNSSIEINQAVSVYELAGLGRTFDVIMCLGVYYHLVDPFAAFAQIRHCCHEGTIVVFEGEATLGIRPDTAFQDFRNPYASLYLPTPYSLSQLLRAAYFTVERQNWRVPPRPQAFGDTCNTILMLYRAPTPLNSPRPQNASD